MLVTLYEISEVFFPLLGTNSFHVKAENKIFTAAGSPCRRNLKYENLASSSGKLRQKIATKSVPHVLNDYFFPIQPIKSFVALSFPSTSSFLKLPDFGIGRLKESTVLEIATITPQIYDITG